jgi:hypothetical protein
MARDSISGGGSIKIPTLTAHNTQTHTHHPKTNHGAHLCPLLCWRLQVNRRRVVAPNSVLILQTRNQSTILLLADALTFQMAAFFYTAAMQMEKLRLTNMTTNLPAKMATTMVMPAAAAVAMVVSGNGSCGGDNNNLEYVTQPKKNETNYSKVE